MAESVGMLRTLTRSRSDEFFDPLRQGGAHHLLRSAATVALRARRVSNAGGGGKGRAGLERGISIHLGTHSKTAPEDDLLQSYAWTPWTSHKQGYITV